MTINIQESAVVEVQDSPTGGLINVEDHSHATNILTPQSEGHGSQMSAQLPAPLPVATNTGPKVEQERSCPFEAWIDNLTEFQETVIKSPATGNVTIADALFKLEANKDIPFLKLPHFDGSPLS